MIKEDLIKYINQEIRCGRDVDNKELLKEIVIETCKGLSNKSK